MPKKVNLNLTEADIETILCVLPLVSVVGTDNPIQAEINNVFCLSASEKLHGHAGGMSANEVRVVSAALTAATLFLSGNFNDRFLEVDDEWKSDIFRHRFSINQLCRIFEGFIDGVPFMGNPKL